MTKPMEAATGTETVRRPRKATVWTKDKIAHLISLYHKHECLWNHKKETYKSKVARNKAINDICETLVITKFDFGKKIHNLRNQFNSEMKKLERRIEESGGNVTLELSIGNDVGQQQRCRWEHFESLIFLRQVIEPRPGGYQTQASGGASNGFPQPKKLCLKFDYNSEDDVSEQQQQHALAGAVTAATISAEDVTEYHFEETAAEDDEITTDDFQNYDETEEEVPPVSSERKQEEDSYDQKYKPPMSVAIAAVAGSVVPTQEISIVTASPIKRTYFTRVHQPQQPQQQKLQQHSQQQSQQQQQQQQQSHEMLHSDSSQRHLPMGSVIELPAVGSIPASNTYTDVAAAAAASAEHNIVRQKVQRDCVFETPRERDQWDAFGELIASELRHLNTNASRKKLKRKMMQAMLEVGEEDDAYGSVSASATN